MEALDALLPRLLTVGVESGGVESCCGRVLAAPVAADRDSPACDVSAMDGFAVRAADLALGVVPVRGSCRIGAAPAALAQGAAAEIVTGAGIPHGADAVVRIEDVSFKGGAITLRSGAGPVKPGAHIRRRGENLRAGQSVLEAGTELTTAGAGALATFGVAEAKLFRRVRACVLATGDELVDARDKPSDWQVRDSSGVAISGVLGRRAWAEVLPARRERDDLELLLGAAAGILAEADALFITGGVSMGGRDFGPEIVRQLGAEIVFHGLPQRPGKPLLGAVAPGGKLILGLPGNPVSSLVTARRFGIPALAKMAGISGAFDGSRSAEVLVDDRKRLELWWHRLVRRNPEGRVELVASASSGDIAAAARADGFVEIGPGECPAGMQRFFGWSW